MGKEIVIYLSLNITQLQEMIWNPSVWMELESIMSCKITQKENKNTRWSHSSVEYKEIKQGLEKKHNGQGSCLGISIWPSITTRSRARSSPWNLPAVAQDQRERYTILNNNKPLALDYKTWEIVEKREM